MFYAPGVMEATAAYRGMSLRGYIDGVALMSPTDIGETVWIYRNNVWEGPFLSVDCSQRGDMYVNIVINREIAEVGFRTARRWGMADYLGERPWYHVYEWREENLIIYIGETPPRVFYSTNYILWFLNLL